jgi:hypothetical protein
MTHYQDDSPDQTGEGNHNPLYCGREDAWRVSVNWYSVTCKLCLRRRARPRKQEADGEA